jgi:hypothetical protein
MERNKIDRVIEAFRHSIQLKEDGMIVGAGQIAGTVEAGDDPPVDLRRRNTKGWNIFFRRLVKQHKKKEKK